MSLESNGHGAGLEPRNGNINVANDYQDIGINEGSAGIS
jgi:hypothetical protein